ncbi:MAG: hypothetical protein J6M18_02525 [Actinomycetaceae bacterium]|nr:hypothetical protein [Actinomycetaceae bacterium]
MSTACTREELEQEAQLRLNSLKEMGLSTTYTSFITNSDTRMYSERVGITEGDPQPLRQEYIDSIAWFEKHTGNCVYAVTVEHSIMGDLLDLVYVSKNKEEWETERTQLDNGYARAYVVSLDQPSATDYFDFYFKLVDGNLVRVG